MRSGYWSDSRGPRTSRPERHNAAGYGATPGFARLTRQMGRSRKLVRRVLGGGDSDVFRCRSSILKLTSSDSGPNGKGGVARAPS